MKWFKHMADASDDEFIAELESLFGWEGYGRWFKLLEIISKQMDKTGRCSASYPWEKWQTFLKGKRKQLDSFLVHLENKRRINLKLTGNILEISCPKLLELRDEYSRNSGVSQDKLRSKKQSKDIRHKIEDTAAKEAASARMPAREEEKNPNASGEDFSKLSNLLEQHYPQSVTWDKNLLHAWLATGFSLELDILPTVERLGRARRGARSLSYFETAIADAHALRSVPPEQRAPPNGLNGKTPATNRVKGKHGQFEQQDYRAGTDGFDVT